MIVIADATPLIALARIQRFSLLHTLYHQIIIPPAVKYEVVQLGAGRAGSAELQTALQKGWISLHPVEPTPILRQLSNRMGRGEAEAIALALQTDADFIILDDQQGRKVALAHHLNVIGTVGIIVQAKQQGHLTDLQHTLDELRANDFHISKSLYNRILQQFG